MKETYFPEINEMYQRIAAKLQQVHCRCMIICNFPTLSFCIHLFSSSALPVTVSSALIMHRHGRIGQLPHPPIPQLQSQQNQLNPRLQSLNVHGSIPTMQQNNMSSLQHGSLSSLSGVSMSQPIMMMRDERF